MSVKDIDCGGLFSSDYTEDTAALFAPAKAQQKSAI